jgi:hypothetical protein
MFTYPNSIVSFICSFVSMVILLDFLLWPRTIKVNEAFGQEIVFKFIAVLVFMYFSFHFRSKAKIHEQKNGWLIASRIINIGVISIAILSYLFSLYIDVVNKN